MGREAHTAVFVNNKVYVGSGFGGIRSNYVDEENSYMIRVYDVVDKQWISFISMPYCWFAMTVLNDQLITAGGQTKNNEAVDKIMALNTDNEKYG